MQTQSLKTEPHARGLSVHHQAVPHVTLLQLWIDSITGNNKNQNQGYAMARHAKNCFR